MSLRYFAPSKTKAPKVRRRKFSARDYASVITRQHGLCACCNEPLGSDPRNIEYDHWVELAIGGQDNLENLRALKKKHHLEKTRSNAAMIAKVRRLEANGGHRRRNHNETERQLAKLLVTPGNKAGRP
jgi:hypothetical protein